MWFHLWPHWLRPELGLCVAGNTAAWPHRYPGLPHNIVCMLAQLLSHVQLFETLCSLSGSSVRGILRQECWSRLPCPPPGDLPNLGIKPVSPAFQADSWPTEPSGKPLTQVDNMLFRYLEKGENYLANMLASVIVYICFPKVIPFSGFHWSL